MLAVNGCPAFTATLVFSGETVTDIGGVMVTVSVADLVGSATAVAVTVAVTLLATLAGASYSTDMVVCLLKAPGPVSFQVTPLADKSFATITEMVTDWPWAIACELPPLKLIERTGGGALVPPPQPKEIVAVKYPAATIQTIQIFVLCLRMAVTPHLFRAGRGLLLKAQCKLIQQTLQ